MAVTHGDARRPSLIWSRLHFLIRVLGLIGFQAGLAGIVLLRPTSFRDLEPVLQPRGWPDYLLLGGFGAAVFALLIEGLVVFGFVAGRRSVFGANALVQVVLAAVLLVGVNVWSFQNPARLDLTRGKQFTLPDDVRKELASLDPKSATSILLYLPHRAGSFAGDKPDPFDLEAEQKTIEKLKDLIELFREVGPQFKVEVLDVGAKGFSDKLPDLAPELKQAIADTSENSIFLHSGQAVQRLSFNQFYRLDRGESERRDNLVLRAVGPGPVTKRLVNVEERRPRVGVLVHHEFLSSEGPLNVYTLSGAKKVLTSHGFDVRDIILRTPNGEPAADSLEVSKLERLQDELDDLDTEIRTLEREITLLERLGQELPKGTLTAINRLVQDYAEQFNPRFVLVRVSEVTREQAVRLFANQLAAGREGLDLAREERVTVGKELAGLSSDKISEQKRLKDLRTRLGRNLAEVDLLFIPRLTMLQSGDTIPPAFHDLESRQAPVIREFLRQGKPILACLGPTNSLPAPGRPGAAIKPPDELEKMFGELGIVLGKRTVLFNVEKRAFAGRDESFLRASKPLQVPPLRVESGLRTLIEELQQTAYTRLREPIAALGVANENPLFALPFLRLAEPARKPNPIRKSLQLADEESGRRMNLRMRFLRPVFLDPLQGHLITSYDPEVLTTSAASWHDEQPFSTTARPVPRFEPPAPDDADNGTLEARRRGPFSVGVAVETRLPADWGGAKKVRVAALGQAGLFSGAELSAGQERLLLDTSNWLLGREEQLASDAPEWSYPRVTMSDDAKRLWLLAARWGLPEVFAFLGLVMLLIRRLR